ncbi:hypothetical protein CDIK_1948 [Cucumispora dikerogammari]|nr:hypothetical protein CDIK_1948 [Cucumispora dikerogammari]
MQLPNKFEKQMDSLISEFPAETKNELAEFYFLSVRNSIKENKITKRVIYSLHAAYTYKKYLCLRSEKVWFNLVNDLMRLKAVEYRVEILRTLDTKQDYTSDKEFVYMPEKWMQTLVMNIREDCNLESNMKLRPEIKETLHLNVLNEIINIFIGSNKFGYRGNLLLVNLIFYEKHILKIDNAIWEIFFNNFEKDKLVKLSQIRCVMK